MKKQNRNGQHDHIMYISKKTDDEKNAKKNAVNFY